MKRLPGGFICAFMLALAVCSPAYAKLFPVTVTVMQHGSAVPDGKSRSFHECWAIREQPAHFILELR